jgi:hypothetical protein
MVMTIIGKKLTNHSIFTKGESLKEFMKRTAMREKRVMKNIPVDEKKNRGPICFDANPKSDLTGPLGGFYMVTVDRSTKQLECNCECFNTWASCIHVVLFELIEFNTYPNMKMRKPDGTKWSIIAEKLKRNVFCRSLFDEEIKEEYVYHQNYIAFFPPLDPQFYDKF